MGAPRPQTWEIIPQLDSRSQAQHGVLPGAWPRAKPAQNHSGLRLAPLQRLQATRRPALPPPQVLLVSATVRRHLALGELSGMSCLWDDNGSENVLGPSPGSRENQSFYTSSLVPCDLPQVPFDTEAGKGNQWPMTMASLPPWPQAPLPCRVLRSLPGTNPQAPERLTYSLHLPSGR